ncbi:hypothetical protein GGR21_001233 [Dysgonomonas hofstadii]|uniref:Lipoprotein n=1 Tax=Dysgonomonas hofstadii TaxID=637886 RepID=A0A840CP79_9BACT|nr:hypothetical protein [Dysgonomonas hofstadii]MBB4035344.1 hypothetical protein [Dysgonomonas hofstadii]
MKYLSLSIVLAFLFLVACNTAKDIHTSGSDNSVLNAYERHLIDSILQCGLDNEALFTLLGDIKPMSSLVTFTFPVANTDSAKRVDGNVLNRSTHGMYLDRMQTIQEAVNKLNIPDLQFIMVPYISSRGNKRTIQLSVVRKSSLDKLLKEKESFYGQFGLVPGTDPVVVVTAIEGNGKFERWRGYGYLFGYPDYAVDFFNQAAIDSEKQGETAKRNAFRIPTYNPKYSNFVYTYPIDHVPTADVDSVLYHRSVKILEEYKNIRNNYLNADSSVQSYRLLRDYYKSKIKK